MNAAQTRQQSARTRAASLASEIMVGMYVAGIIVTLFLV
jgi:hypothetical protein